MRSTFSALTMLGTLMLYGGGASAGSGGAVGGLGTPLLAICNYLGMDMDHCPTWVQFASNLSPEITEIAALTNANPGGVRSMFLDVNPSPIAFVIPPDNAVSAVNPTQAFFAPNNLSHLSPIAFIKGSYFYFADTGVAGATLRGDPAASSFFYAVTTGDRGNSGDRGDRGDRGEREDREDRGRPETLVLAFDYLPQTQATFLRNQDIGDIMFPLAVLKKDGSERSVPTTLHISAACAGDFARDSRCLTAIALGDFLGNGTTQQHSAAEVGLSFRADYGKSPNSPIQHAIYEVRVPLLVKLENDPAYFGVKAQIGGSPPAAKEGSPTGINQITGDPTAFDHDLLGFTPEFLQMPIGVAPGAAKFAASFSNNGDGASHPAVYTFLAIRTDGATVSHRLRICSQSAPCDPLP